MTSAADERTSAPTESPRRGTVLAGVAIGAVLVACVVLALATTSALWLDEALSVNIAKVPLSDLVEVLKRDGAPPLYYLLLHFWIQVFGDGDTAVRGLSEIMALATIPAMYFAGRRLGGRAAGWVAVLLFASAPYTFRYATETRMYALIMFLVAWGYLAVLRALERPSVGRCALVTLVVAALLYTHNWSYYLLATVGMVLLLRAWRGATAEDRRSAWWVILAMVVGGLCYLPWLPVVRYQLAHTGTPWGDPALPWAAFPWFLDRFAGVNKPRHGEWFGYQALAIVLALLALFGAAVDRRHVDLDLRTRRTVRWELVVGLGAIGLGLVLSYEAGAAFDGRYGSIGVPLLLLAMAIGVMVFASPRIRIGVLSLLIVFGLVAGVRNVQDERTQAVAVAAALASEARPGDVVVYCPDQLGPAVHRLLGDDRGLVEVTFPALGGPKRVNWVDYRKRIDATSTATVAQQILERAEGVDIWYVVAPGYRSLEGRCETLERALKDARPASRSVVVQEGDLYWESMGLKQLAVS